MRAPMRDRVVKARCHSGGWGAPACPEEELREGGAQALRKRIKGPTLSAWDSRPEWMSTSI